MANPLLKRVKIGTFWQDIVYENLPMLCYKCGRLGHREPHYSEGTAEPTTAPPQESNPHVQAAPPLEPTHTLIPWKTVQTRRTHARRRPSELTSHGKSTLPDSYSPVHPHGQATLSHAHVKRTHQINSMIGQEFDGVKRPAGFYCGKVASHGNNTNLLQPFEEGMECMHEPCKAGCPSLLLQPSDVALDGICNPCMANCPSKYQHTPHVHGMQQGRDKRAIQ